jgi:very-short-patch-repair endonuclease
MPEPIDPEALLHAHQLARLRGSKIVSVIVGPMGMSRATFVRWLRKCQPSLHVAVPQNPSHEAANSTLASFANRAALLLVPAEEELGEAVGTAKAIAEETPVLPVSVVTGYKTVERTLLHANTPGAVRDTIFGGLVPIVEEIAGKLGALAPYPRVSPPYRSHHEHVLHMLVLHDASIKAMFEPNRLVQGASLTRYEVDLWCKELKLALEIDGKQHTFSMSQISRDKKRDADLAHAGIKTVRVLASAVMSDPTMTLRMVRQEIDSRTKEFPL